MPNVYMYVIVAVVVAAIASSLTAFIYNRNNKAMFNQMNSMLDKAINNTFAESSYDETMLSQMETKLNRFLIASTTGERDISREKDRIKMLISDISHQTKTPIANILLYVQLLQEQEQTGSPTTDLSSQIAQQSEKLNFLIQALIKTSRMEAGIIYVNPQPNRIKDLIQRTVAQVEEQAQLKRIMLNIECEEGLTAIFDPKWTEEALFNIVDNSIKYTPEQGMITISTTAYELFIRMDITDTGIGMEEYEINQIFKRFYRSPQVSQVEGVGIGLYLTREIITMQKGYIKVSSAVQKGSTFSIFLPREPSPSKSFNTDRFPKEA